MAYVLIAREGTVDFDHYSVDTDEEILEARKALREHGIEKSDIWVGSPDGLGDSYRNGHVLFAGEADGSYGEFRAYDTVTEWQGVHRHREDEAKRDAEAHNEACVRQGGYGSAVVVRRDGDRCVDLEGKAVWPPYGRTMGAARWR